MSDREPVRFESAGEKPADVPGHVWKQVPNPNAGNCEASWWWALYPIQQESDMLDVHWTTDYEGVANSFGYHVHNTRARQAVAAAGVVLSQDAPVAFHVVPPQRFEPIAGKVKIAYCAWEARELPELFRKTLAPADVICVTAEFLRKPFEAMFPDKPIHVVPEGVDAEVFSYVDRSKADRRPNFRPAGRGRPFRYLWVGAPNARKGPLHVIEAWKAFEHNESFELYLKTSLPADSKVRVGQKRIGNVIYDDRRVSIDELVGIYHRAHCFVFPSIGEGFGLTFAEAMATGLPCIYTPATSLVDLAPVDQQLGFPVRFNWTPEDWSWKDADAHGTPMDVHVTVANADVYDVVEQMVAVKANPLAAFERGARAAQFVRERFTWERCGKLLRHVIESLHPACQKESTCAC